LDRYKERYGSRPELTGAATGAVNGERRTGQLPEQPEQAGADRINDIRATVIIETHSCAAITEGRKGIESVERKIRRFAFGTGCSNRSSNRGSVRSRPETVAEAGAGSGER
jgi:hypothetical protein